MKRPFISFLVVLAIFIGVSLCQAAGDPENGKRLFESPTLGGGTTGKTCAGCHPAGRNLSRRMFPEVGDTAEVKAQKMGRLTGMVNTCIERPLAGQAIDPEGSEMADIIAYMKGLVE